MGNNDSLVPFCSSEESKTAAPIYAKENLRLPSLILAYSIAANFTLASLLLFKYAVNPGHQTSELLHKRLWV